MNIKTAIKNIIGPSNIYRAKKQIRAILNNKNYKEEINLIKKRINFYKTFLNPGEIVFDIGANLGNRVEAFLKMGLRVIAIEPQPFCTRELKIKFRNKITIVEKGVASQKGKMKMHLSNIHMLSTFVPAMEEKVHTNRFQNAVWNDSIEVEMTTLDELIRNYGRPKFIKIDVEGFEPEVLKGLTMEIDLISFEYMVPEMFDNLVTCLDLLQKLNTAYKFNYSIGESMEFSLDKFMVYSDFLEIIKMDEFMNTSFGDIYAIIKD